jgi:TatA/E family protein of Tat protein translocase
VGQIANLRRIVNPPAARGRARHDRGESPPLSAAGRYAGQLGKLRVGCLPAQLAGFQPAGFPGPLDPACYHGFESLYGRNTTMGPLGVPEMIFIFFLALILFGPKKMPELGRSLGKALTEFRRAQSELKSTFEREMKTLEQETESLKEVANEVTNQYPYDTYNYDYSSYDSTPDGSYPSEISDSTVATPSTPSASAPEGAESPSAEAPEGTVAHGAETAAGHTEHTETATPTAEHIA